MTYALEGERKRLENESLSNDVKQAITRFVNYEGARGVTKHRQYFYLSKLRKVAPLMGDSFLHPDEQDVLDVINELQNGKNRNGKPYSVNSINDFKVTIKKFYKWYYEKVLKSGNVEDIIGDIRKTKLISNQKSEEVITQQEVRDMAAQARNRRDRFLVSVLFDSGCRISELLTLKIKDVVQDKYSLILHVTGKTGERRVRCFGDSIPTYMEWLMAHPHRDNHEAYLFIKTDSGNIDKDGLHEMMDYNAAAKVIRTLKKRAGITKRIHPHQFRHTRATILARDLKSAPLEKVMGWRPGSDMSKFYVHLTDSDVDKALFKVYNIEFDEEKIGTEERLPRKCERCDTINESDSKFCRKCGLPFSAKIAQEFDRLNQEQDEIVDVVSSMEGIDPLIKSILPDLDPAQKLNVLNTLLDKFTEDPEFKSEMFKAIKDRLDY